MQATRICSRPGCARTPVARSLCQHHYDQQAKVCRGPGCTRLAQSYGLCRTHAEGDPSHPRCTYPGCALALRTAGLCFRHYEAKRRGKELRPFVDWSLVPCRGPLCKRNARYNSGYCLRHHQQKRDTGEVWVIGTRRGRLAQRAVCITAECESTRIAAHGRCYLHLEDRTPDTCWLPWCSTPPSEATGLCEAHRVRHNRLVHEYGIGWPERMRLAQEQDGQCAICGAPDVVEDGEPALHVDHCHETGRVRGLLCGACNRGLGLMRDDPRLLANAITYLCGQ
ncbi:endonuclease VII domain-containing protein [Streptomyces sp. NPDC059944]|uniref:endonuclease VII domain-containing protein n=1 Tax=Streptomyces TaxID=1883 RepID=UPI0036657AD5